MVSFDVTSLFTNVPLKETIDLCCEIWSEFNPNKSSLDDIAFRDLLTFATSNVQFLFNDEWYRQIDGVAMGSPLAPTLASIFLSKLESKINDYSCVKPLVYKRYVDDIFLVFENRSQVHPFLEYMNSLHPNIDFTVEEEINSTIPFLDMLVERKNASFETEIFRKKTDTGLLTNPASFCDIKYKSNMIKGLIHRSWSLSSTFIKADKSLNKLIEIIHKNGYSKCFTDKLVYETLSKLNSDISCVDVCEVVETNPKIVLSLPYSEGFKKFKLSIENALKDIVNIKVVSQSHKVINMFNNKSITPLGLCSDLVYQFKCNGCNATYVGETSRHLCTRIQEHSRNSGNSNIVEHRKKCLNSIGSSDFKILCSGLNNYWERVMCEALLIRALNPKINVQLTDSTSLLKLFY